MQSSHRFTLAKLTRIAIEGPEQSLVNFELVNFEEVNKEKNHRIQRLNNKLHSTSFLISFLLVLAANLFVI